MLRRPPIALLPLLVIVVLASAWLFLFALGGPVARLPPPNPNGYDDFVRAAGLLSDGVGNAHGIDADQLRALVTTNMESLRLLRLGLTRECALPKDSALAVGPGMAACVQNLYRLANLLNAEGRLREVDQRLADALQSYIDSIHLGNEMSRGGFVFHRLIGLSCEELGCTELSRLVPTLDPKDAPHLVAELEKIDSATVTWDEVLRNEYGFHQYQGCDGVNLVRSALRRWRGRRLMQVANLQHTRMAAHVRLLTVELALRCHQSEQWLAPTNLAQLVPNYLGRVPADPFTGRPMIYRPEGPHWLLYSVGEDGVDNDGDPVTPSVPGAVTKGDIFYNSPY
jgi:hypothetical protein